MKSGTTNCTEVNLLIYSNVDDDSNDGNKFPHNQLLTNTHVSGLCKAFAHNSSINIKFSETQLHKIRQPGGLLSKILGPLLKTGFLLTGHSLGPLAKSVLTAAVSTTEEAIHKKCLDPVILL